MKKSLEAEFLLLISNHHHISQQQLFILKSKNI